MANENSLWPEFKDFPKIKSPRSILLEQAAYLSNSTKNLLNANVINGTNSDGKIMIRFNISAPLLKGYSYHLFSVIHGAIYYPCEIHYKTILICTNETDFKRKLSEIFNDYSTKNVIISLIGQSKEIEDEQQE